MVMQSPEQPVKVRRKIDTVLACLVTIAKLLGIPADMAQLKRAYVFEAKGMDDTTFIRAALELGLKSRKISVKSEGFKQVPLPAVAILKNGNHVVVARIENGQVILIDPYENHPVKLPLSNFFNAWNGQLILVTRRTKGPSKSEKFSLAWFVPNILRYKKMLSQVLLVSFLLQLFGLVSPLFTQVIIDKVLVHRSLDTLDIFVLGMGIITTFQALLTVLRAFVFSNTTNKIDVALSSKLYRHITALPLKYFESWQVGDVVSRVRELETIRSFITGSALTVLIDTAFTIVYIAVMFYYSSLLSIIALLALPIYILLNAIVTPIYRRRINERFAAGTETQTFLIETVTGIQTVKSLALETNFVSKWEQMLARYVKASFSTANLSNIAGNIGSFIQGIFNLAILWAGAYAVMDNKISIGQLIAFQMLAGQVTAPVLRLVNMWQYFQQTMVSVDRLGDILNESCEPAFNPNRATLPSIRGDIRLDMVTFRYRPDTSEVLNKINLTIKAGSSIGIVGRSGSGKSTLTKLIQRLYTPESGRVLIDGIDLIQIEPAWLRRQVGVVLQENFLFNGSITSNIAIAKPEATQDEILRVSRIAGVDEFASQLSSGYETSVGERGTALSGGQRQRIAIARSLLTDPRILIFDEATSALDYESERIIMDNLQDIAAGRTMIMIAHRLATVKHCDLIVVLDKGKVIETGSHDQLLLRKGLYYSMYQQQDSIK